MWIRGCTRSVVSTSGFNFQTAARILATRLRPRFRETSRPEREGRAGRRVLAGPSGSGISRHRSGTMLFDEAPSDCREPQVRHLSGVPHAMFEALFRTTPGGLTLARSRSSHGSGTYPPLRGPRSCADDGYRLTHNHPEPPVARGRRAGTVQLRLLCRGGTSRRPSHSHRTRSQPRDVRETSLGGSR